MRLWNRGSRNVVERPEVNGLPLPPLLVSLGIALDYRAGAEDPRVIASNWWSGDGASGAR